MTGVSKEEDAKLAYDVRVGLERRGLDTAIFTPLMQLEAQKSALESATVSRFCDPKLGRRCVCQRWPRVGQCQRCLGSASARKLA